MRRQTTSLYSRYADLWHRSTLGTCPPPRGTVCLPGTYPYLNGGTRVASLGISSRALLDRLSALAVCRMGRDLGVCESGGCLRALARSRFTGVPSRKARSGSPDRLEGLSTAQALPTVFLSFARQPAPEAVCLLAPALARSLTALDLQEQETPLTALWLDPRFLQRTPQASLQDPHCSL